MPLSGASGSAGLALEVSMTVNRLAGFVYVLICAVGMGYWLVPSARHEGAASSAVAADTTELGVNVASVAMAVRPAVAIDRRVQPIEPIAAVVVSAPELHARIKPVLNRGTDVAVASADFKDATEFAAVAHAARNTKIPFMVLKYRVVTERMTLADAIRASLPQANAEVEADLAMAEARYDIAGLVR